MLLPLEHRLQVYSLIESRQKNVFQRLYNPRILIGKRVKCLYLDAYFTLKCLLSSVSYHALFMI